jgi:fatty-acyl-CoA synthase
MVLMRSAADDRVSGKDMKIFNLKTIIRHLLPFVNFRTMVKLYMGWLWFRRNRPFFIFEGAPYTYGEVYRQSKRYADFFRSERKKIVDRGSLKKSDRFSIGIYMDNTPEFLFAAFAAGLSNSILFAINTGFRGDTLAKVVEKANITHLIVNSSTLEEVLRALPDIHTIGRDNILFVGDDQAARDKGFRSLEEAVIAAETQAYPLDTPPIDNFSPVLIIYTSGTSGLPKGVPCTHVKMFGAGAVVRREVHLTRKDRGYVCMPLFHSNAWYIGVLSQLIAGGSFVLKRRFSASAFEEDILEHGVTFMNYVGQPLHYIVSALEKKYGSGEAVEKALAKHPANRFRKAYGNGASVVDRKKLTLFLGMEHIYEIYGSTEAVITSANKPGDPIESVGEVPKSVVVLDEQDRECAPGEVDDKGQLVNYDQAVGEICRIRSGKGELAFDGYFADASATQKKFRGGFYHSGDLGHIRLVNGKRYLFFNGRTDDWIRKDGENFSAENVLEYAQAIPCVDIAIAYGTPSEVSDENVMIAVQLKHGSTFDPEQVYAWYRQKQKEGGLDPKWMPDYIRIVDVFPLTDTQKIIVRPYKKENYNIESNPTMEIYYRMRGDNTYKKLTQERYQEIKELFRNNGREALLVQG